MSEKRKKVKSEALELFNSIKKQKIDLSHELINNVNEPIQDRKEKQLQNALNDDVESVLENNNSETETIAPKINSLKELMAEWSIKHNITTTAVNELLNILKQFFPELSTDSRTLRHTPRDALAVTSEISGGVYMHYGLENCLTDFIENEQYEGNEITLNFNVDGLPVSKGSNR